MLRSLFSAISGLRANQTMLDVTGNNIANANTVGFKSSNVVFQDTLSPDADRVGAPTATTGGTNPIQVGLGVQVGGVTTNFNQGSAQVTGRATNLMISGDGFFVVHRGNQEIYTRAGAFNFDSTGNLVTPDGDIVQGYKAVGRHHQPGRRPTENIEIADMVDDTADPGAAVLQHRRRRRDHRHLLRRHQAAAVPDRAGELRQPGGPGEGRRHRVPREHQLGRGPGRRPRLRPSRLAA